MAILSTVEGFNRAISHILERDWSRNARPPEETFPEGGSPRKGRGEGRRRRVGASGIDSERGSVHEYSPYHVRCDPDRGIAGDDALPVEVLRGASLVHVDHAGVVEVATIVEPVEQNSDLVGRQG